MKRTAIFVVAGLMLLGTAASAYVKHRHHHAQNKQAKAIHHASHLLHHAQNKQAKAFHHASHLLRRAHAVHPEAAPLGCLPAELRAKVVEIVGVCGSHVIRTFTPGALIFGTHYLSEHAFCRAADLAGNPTCIYAHLRGFRGGVTTDYARMAHVHVSWHPGGWEQGVRFVHRGYGARSSIALAGR
jgi:hypothetical protein